MPKTSTRPKIYLAGPEVFLRNAAATGAAKVEIRARNGLDGKFPLDTEIDFTGLTLAECGYAIFRANEALMLECDAVIANLTPFRGVGMDVGTAFEIGFMRGKGRPVFGYSNSHLSHFDRVHKFERGKLKARDDGNHMMAFEDRNKMGVEQFEFAENLMIEAAVRDSAGEIVRSRTKRRVRYADLSAFEECVKQVAAVLSPR